MKASLTRFAGHSIPCDSSPDMAVADDDDEAESEGNRSGGAKEFAGTEGLRRRGERERKATSTPRNPLLIHSFIFIF